jgi:glucose/arabinose dehydrogenase
MGRRVGIAAALAGLGLAMLAPSAGAATRLVRVVTGLSKPVQVTQAPHDGGRLFIVEQGGRIIVDQAGHLLSRPFLNISNLVSGGGEQGLLSMAFDPAYSRTGRFFVSYTNTAGDSRIVQYRVSASNPNVANPSSRRILLKVHQPFANHNGGDIAFGPGGQLFIGFGDGGSEKDPNLVGQRRTGALSKILRMDVNAARPRATMYAYGLRNPWRFSFDRSTGGLWIGDVGQDRYEEVDHVPAHLGPGTNFGWSYYEGDHVFKPQPINRRTLRFPVAEYSHAGGNCSVTGGYVYRGAKIPTLRGYYLFADFCSGRIWRLRPGGRPAEMRISRQVRQISSFGQGIAGELYVVSLAGSVYKIVAR